MGEVDAAYVALMQRLLDHNPYPAIRHARSGDDRRDQGLRARSAVSRTTRFEFQMLYGIRRDLQSSLVAEGYRVRVYVPFGQQWFPYFMRRLGERPANVGFVLKGILRER